MVKAPGAYTAKSYREDSKVYAYKEYRTFAEMFLEKPQKPEEIKTKPGQEYIAKFPIPTYCTWKKIPTIDDLDWIE